jgi:fumarate reductase flavoprotein subunit
MFGLYAFHAQIKKQALNVFEESIPDLCAAGEILGGFHGAGHISGYALGMGLIYGGMAG